MRLPLPQTLAAVGTPELAAVLAAELAGTGAAAPLLQAGLSHGSHVSGERFHLMLLAVKEGEDAVAIAAGIHYRSVVAGCSCADDPTPMDSLNEYCELAIRIERGSAAAEVNLAE